MGSPTAEQRAALVFTAPAASQLLERQEALATRDTHNTIVRPLAYASVAACIGAAVGGLWRQSWPGVAAGAGLGAVLGAIVSKVD